MDRINFQASYAKAKQGMIAKNEESYSNNYDYLEWRTPSRLKDYSLEEIDRIINSGSITEQRKLSRNYFNKDGLYRRIIIHYASLCKYNGLLSPLVGYGKQLSTDAIAKRFYNALDYLSKINIKGFCTNIVLKALIDGSYYGVIQNLNKKDFAILDLPSGYCASRFKDFYGRDIIEFNLLYFDTLGEDCRDDVLNSYPKCISSAYKKYKKNKESNCWIKIPVEMSICLSFFDEGLPLFLNVIPATIQYDNSVEIERERSLEEIRKVLVQKIPHLSDGQLLFEPDEALEMHLGSVDMMKNNKNFSVLTTYADVDAIVSKTASDADSNNLEKMLQNVYSQANVSTQIFSPTGSQALDNSLRNDLAFMMILINKISYFISNIINELFSNSNISFKYQILPLTYYNQSDFIADSYKLAQSGYSLLLPAIALDIDQKQLIGLKDLENDLMNLGEKLKPLSSSYTQSSNDGGRPTVDTEDKKATTIQKEESINSKGGLG